jgi:8-oxo-dGTP pyrophosphatase MutT (NUDIX family)
MVLAAPGSRVLRTAPEPLAAPDQSPAIRPAATVILVRHMPDGPRVLMGQRGARAAFMPEMFVFPGGAVDPEDLALQGDVPLDPDTAARLAVRTEPELVSGLARAAVRELWEETGLVLGRPAGASTGLAVPESWRGFFAAGYVPHTAPLRFVFRAITPPGRPRRFDARFFLVDADALAPGGDDFAGAGGELANLQWLDLVAARALPLPFITEVVLAETEALLAAPERARRVPFFHQEAGAGRFTLL